MEYLEKHYDGSIHIVSEFINLKEILLIIDYLIFPSFWTPVKLDEDGEEEEAPDPLQQKPIGRQDNMYRKRKRDTLKLQNDA